MRDTRQCRSLGGLIKVINLVDYAASATLLLATEFTTIGIYVLTRHAHDVLTIRSQCCQNQNIPEWTAKIGNRYHKSNDFSI